MIKSRNNYLTSRDASAILGVTHDHVRKLIRTGKIKAEKLGHNWIIPRRSLENVKRMRFPKAKEQEIVDNAAHE